MLEALWSVKFSTSLGLSGSGVVVFESGRIFGGDSQYYYIGKFEIKNGQLNGELEVKNYAGELWSVFGFKKEFKLNVSGLVPKSTNDEFKIEGTLEDDPSMKILIHLTRIAELP